VSDSRNVRYPSEFEAKKNIIEIGRRMYMKGFVAANDGNISCRVSPNEILCTPTGVSKGFLTPDMLVRVDMSGKVISGKMKPSSEVKMHLRVYQELPETMAVTHAHPPVATSFAIAGIPLDRAILPESVVILGTVPIAKYALTGSTEVPDSIAPYVKNYNAVLLANHGALTWGRSIDEAFYRLEEVEYFAQVTMNVYSILGRSNELSCSQVQELMKVRNKFGIETGGLPTCATTETNTADVVSSQEVSSPSVSLTEEPSGQDLSGIIDQITSLVLQRLKG
jgi:L-fuculose-phosphate aldolase